MNPTHPGYYGGYAGLPQTYLADPFSSQVGSLLGGLGVGLAGRAVDPLAAYSSAIPLQPQSFLLPQSELDTERQALDAFYEDATAGLLQQLNKYLDENTGQHKELADCVPLVQRAVDLYEARNFQAAFLQLLQAYRFIVRLRARVPGLPIP